MADPHHAPDSLGHDDYVRGSQEISEQAATFSLFMALAKWGSLLTAVSVLFLVMWFQPGGSFIAGAIAAFVLLVVGIFALRSKKKH
ncbi:aa3-type cytochrome c oxidase subunit IV [Brevundimonas sp.]|uniref:aa3-type cytochrome c oxidase subunit IV n=1 Tax=Brevundimonas sp. TaxID=1871086 RepID=UPI002D2CD565|nr:aa3-type cytochrome c oxidase subunit IV [Brevundimonas sp.]HYC74209.1 aa3-type cytochrome c oxidase subunit IV [Brevundimonas sp.]